MTLSCQLWCSLRINDRSGLGSGSVSQKWGKQGVFSAACNAYAMLGVSAIARQAAELKLMQRLEKQARVQAAKQARKQQGEEQLGSGGSNGTRAA